MGIRLGKDFFKEVYIKSFNMMGDIRFLGDSKEKHMKDS